MSQGNTGSATVVTWPHNKSCAIHDTPVTHSMSAAPRPNDSHESINDRARTIRPVPWQETPKVARSEAKDSKEIVGRRGGLLLAGRRLGLVADLADVDFLIRDGVGVSTCCDANVLLESRHP